jgi:hypothetical protein
MTTVELKQTIDESIAMINRLQGGVSPDFIKDVKASLPKLQEEAAQIAPILGWDEAKVKSYGDSLSALMDTLDTLVNTSAGNDYVKVLSGLRSRPAILMALSRIL